MAKIIKRVGIVFFVLVISFLLILGCVFAVNSATKDKNAEIQNNEGNVQTTADKTYNIDYYSNKESVWNEAIQYSINNKALVQVNLYTIWIAATDSNYGTSFGTGVGFSAGRIYVPTGANIALRMGYKNSASQHNHYKIDRKLTSPQSNGEVFYVCGKLKIFDEYFDDYYYSRDLKEGGTTYINAGNTGAIITGGNSTSGCSAIKVQGTAAEFVLDGGFIYNNYASTAFLGGSRVHAGAIFVSSGATAYLKSGLIGGNKINKMGAEYESDNVGAVYLDSYNSTVYLGGTSEFYGNGRNQNISIEYNQCGTICRISGTVNLLKSVCIDNNTYLGRERNLDTDCYITGDFVNSGVIYCSDNKVYGSYVIYNFSNYMNGVNPARYFIHDSTDKVAVTNSSGNVVFQSAQYVTKPTTSVVYKEYTGNAQTHIPAGYNSSTMNLTSESKTNVNPSSEFYYTNISPKEGYLWSDSKKYEVIHCAWRITPKPITKPTVRTSSFEYNGQVKTLQLNNYSSTTMNITGNTATNVGTYTAVISRKNSNYKWSDDTYGNLTFTWTITPKPISKPTAADSNEYIFNNAEQTYMPKGYNSSTMVITDNKNTNVGEYTAKVTPNSNHKWSDNTTTAIEFKYRIFPPGVVVKDGVKYDYLYIDSNNIKKSYGNSYIHRVDDQNLNLVNGISRHILGNIPINTSIETFLQNLYSDRNLIKIYAKESDITPIYDGLSGTRSNLSQTLATGYKVELYSNSTDTTPFDTIYLSVLGDINGDGMINASDVSYLRQVANDNTLLENMPLERQLACMINNKGGVTEVDSEILRNYIGKEIDLDKFMESETENTNTGYTYLTLDRDNMLRKANESKTNVIGNISVNTSVEMLKTKLAEMGINISSLTIYNRKGDEVSDNTAMVGTGWSIEVGGEVTYLSVLGDLTGDGRITAADISYLRAIAASDTTTVQDCILLSAILLNKGGITTADSEVLKQAIKGSILLSEYKN